MIYFRALLCVIFVLLKVGIKITISKVVIWVLFFAFFLTERNVLSHEIRENTTFSPDKLDVELWNNDIYIGDNNYTIKTIAEILESNVSNIVTNFTNKNIQNINYTVESNNHIDYEISDKYNATNIKHTNYFDKKNQKYHTKLNNKRRSKIDVYKLYRLPAPEKRTIKEIKYLLNLNNIEFGIDNTYLENNELYDDIVYIRNSTINISGEDLLRNFIFDSDSICRLSIQWFERYPRYINIMRENQNSLNIDKNTHNSSNNIKRSFIDKWINILKQLKTLEINENSFNSYKSYIKKQAKDDPTRFRKYHKNISVELHTFNILLMKLLSKLGYYMPYILYFPKTGNMNKIFCGNKENNCEMNINAINSNNAKYEDNILRNINKVDLFMNEISSEIIESVYLALSSCSSVIEIILKYGVENNNTPKEIITLFIQYKKIVRILLGVLSHKDNNKKNRLISHDVKQRPIESSYSFNQNEYPNKIGFKPHSMNIDIRNNYNKNIKNITNNQIMKVEFNFVSENEVKLFCSNNELNFYNKIKNDVLIQVNKELNSSSNLDVSRPNGLSGLVLYDQKYSEESQYDCTLNIKKDVDGSTNITINNISSDDSLSKDIVRLFKDDILGWFKLYYFDRLLLDERMSKDYFNSNEINILLQLKLLIACTYLSNNYIGMNNLGNSYTLIYLIGRAKNIIPSEWNIVTKFNRININTESQINFLSVIIPSIKNDIKGMCLLQNMNNNNKVPKYIRESSNFTFEKTYLSNFELENQNISKSIIKNCLNYIDNGTVIKYIFNDGNKYLKCVDGNLIIQ
ncbi:hypothetical protein FG386_003681 [Cryptosporidium ryanae]|uniref:uncharacterized protein n=1 Tax=Cryptosporidium ryanae TaxID=515981 RepID=UPI00351A1255|nr:hypothetical protein FG386_003681 [Cryptosporidium ryanae]